MVSIGFYIESWYIVRRSELGWTSAKPGFPTIRNLYFQKFGNCNIVEMNLIIVKFCEIFFVIISYEKIIIQDFLHDEDEFLRRSNPNHSETVYEIDDGIYRLYLNSPSKGYSL